MRKRNPNKIYNRFDLGRVPVQKSPDVPKPETLLQLAERMQREEQERINAPVTAAQREQRSLLLQRDADCRKVWSMPIEKLRHLDRDVLEVSMPSFDVVTTDYDNLDAESGTRTGQEAKRTLDDFINTLPQRSIHLNSDGVSRFRLFVSALAVFRSAAITTELLSRTAFPWIVECFGDELRVDSVPAVEPIASQKSPTIDDVLKQGLDGSRESERRLARAVENDFVSETGELAQQFVAHLRDVWNFTPDNESWRALFNPQDGYVVRQNLSLMDPRTFDKCRLFAASSGLWPSHLRTAQESLDSRFRKDPNCGHGFYLHTSKVLASRGLTNRPMLEATDVLGLT